MSLAKSEKEGRILVGSGGGGLYQMGMWIGGGALGMGVEGVSLFVECGSDSLPFPSLLL